MSTTGNEKYFPKRSAKIDDFLMLRPNLKEGVKNGNKIYRAIWLEIIEARRFRLLEV